MTDQRIEAVARRLAYDEWPLAPEAERAAWAQKHWHKWVGRAENAIVAADAVQQKAGGNDAKR